MKGVDLLKDHIKEPTKISERMWSGFLEIELLIDRLATLIGVCFDFMPSSVEIIEPEKLSEDSEYMSDVLNDLTARLHQYDAVAKMLRAKLTMQEKEKSS
jgi:hypothetical protein